MNYSPSESEPKWQQYWRQQRTFIADTHPTKPKYYVLDMFPYPSGSGLHVGHGIGYTVTDIIARYKRMKGFNVLHPMGWDSFGLPAEQYAVRTGTHPAVTTDANIATFKDQLQAYGYSYDWERELRTSDPSYYKWTQWIFTLLYEKGLAYQAKMYVNFCPFLGTVLANEEVEDGKSVEGGHPVVRQPLQQWVLKITQYADRLLEDLDLLDWPANLKKQQENWIGRSEGALIHFKVEGHEKQIDVFTTCSDTIFGITYLVLAPEHPLVHLLTTHEERKNVENYLISVQTKSDLQRTDLNKEKTGVFTGSYAGHPVTGERLAIWIADYVLVNYATGAVMGVPAHDERDFHFATKYNLPIRQVIETPNGFFDVTEGYFGDGNIVNSSFEDLNMNGMTQLQAKACSIDWLTRHLHGKKQVSYKLRDWLFSRQRYWGEPMPILHFEDGSQRSLGIDELPLLPPDVTDYKPSGDGQSPLAKQTDWVHVIDKKTGRHALRETNTMPQWAGSCWYYLRFVDPHNDHEAWSKALERYWMPVDTYVGGAEHAVLHLLYSRFWHKVLYDCGLVSTKEPFMQLRNQGMVVAKAYKLAAGGYAACEDVAYVDGKWVHKTTGQSVVELVEKMSKSKLNGVSPEEVMRDHGADALRLYSMFMGPFDKEKLWDSKAVSGCSRFLRRVAALFDEKRMSDEENDEAMILIHKLCHDVEHEFEQWQFNVAIAKMMEFINDFEKLPRYPVDCLERFVKLLSPMAPHLAEELWQGPLGHTETISYEAFPVADRAWLEKAEGRQVTYIVQINGKLRGRLELARGITQEVVQQHAFADEGVKRHIEGKKILKTIFVQDKLLNLVVTSD